MMRTYCCTLLLLCLTNFCLAAEPAAWLIKIQIKTGNPQAKAHDPNVQIVSAPQVVSLDGQQFKCEIGQSVAVPEGIADQDHPATLGTAIHGRVKKAQAPNQVWLDLSIKQSDWIENPQDKQEITIHARETRAIKLLPVQQVYKVELPKQPGQIQSWVEVTIDAASNAK
jgi:hypothetical protein